MEEGQNMAVTSTLTVDLKISPDLQAILDCVDMLGVALAAHNHQWADEERNAYERAVAALRRNIDTGIGEKR